MIRIKPGVEFSHASFMNPEVMRIPYLVQKHAPEGYEITVTSGCDGVHSTPQSAHYSGRAFDFRTRDFPAGLATWQHRVQEALGSCYFVLLEKDHLHVQYNG